MLLSHYTFVSRNQSFKRLAIWIFLFFFVRMNIACSFTSDAFELITEKEDGTLQFNVPYHYASVVRDVRSKDADMFNINRARRLAQEVASLSTSLPLSFSSTVFLRCDEQRLDIMKVKSTFIYFFYSCFLLTVYQI